MPVGHTMHIGHNMHEMSIPIYWGKKRKIFQNGRQFTFFSSSEQKLRVSYCDHPLSIVLPCPLYVTNSKFVNTLEVAVLTQS